MIKVLIDNGHGSDTPGKCSPAPHALREYLYCRQIADDVVRRLHAEGVDASLLVPEENDIKLSERTRRVNEWCKKLGSANVLLVSIHNNAAGADGKWHSASGWSGWAAPKASEKSKDFARMLCDEAIAAGLMGNRAIPATKYWTGNFAIVRDTKCPAVLTENLFQDNRKDVDFLLSEEGRAAVVNIHVQAIKKYIDKYDSK